MSETPPERQPHAGLRDSVLWWVRTAAIIVAAFYGWQLLLIVRGWVAAVIEVVLLFVFGLVLALLVEPLVRLLERRGLSRTIASLLVLLALLAVLIAGLLLLAAPLVTEADQLTKRIPGLVQRSQDYYNRLRPELQAHGLDVSPAALFGLGSAQLSQHLVSLVIDGLQATAAIFVDTVVVLVVAFWLLRDGAELRAGFLRALPTSTRSHVAFAFEATAAVVGGYVRAQLTIALMLGVLAGVGSYLLGVPYPIVVGLAAGVFELVPLVGPFAGGAVGVTLALTKDPLLAVWTVLLFLGIHFLEGYVVAPRIQARFMRVHTLIAFLAIFAGIEAAGFLGALFAVPVVSLVSVFVRAALGDIQAGHPELYESRRSVLTARRRRLVEELRGSWVDRFRRRKRPQVG
jgi:predicted PurR-regulated permease PerM